MCLGKPSKRLYSFKNSAFNCLIFAASLSSNDFQEKKKNNNLFTFLKDFLKNSEILAYFCFVLPPSLPVIQLKEPLVAFN